MLLIHMWCGVVTDVVWCVRGVPEEDSRETRVFAAVPGLEEDSSTRSPWARSADVLGLSGVQRKIHQGFGHSGLCRRRGRARSSEAFRGRRFTRDSCVRKFTRDSVNMDSVSRRARSSGAGRARFARDSAIMGSVKRRARSSEADRGRFTRDSVTMDSVGRRARSSDAFRGRFTRGRRRGLGTIFPAVWDFTDDVVACRVSEIRNVGGLGCTFPAAIVQPSHRCVCVIKI